MRAFLRRHWFFLVVLAAGTTLRALTWAAYQPAFFYSDSVDYLKNTGHWPGTSWHPPGYPLVLDVLDWGHHLAVVTAVQHLLVIGAAVAIYALLLRLGCGRFVAGLATLPVLLDAYQLDIEQYVLAEAVFEAFLVAALVTLLWPARRPTLRAVIAGVLLGFAALIRLDALALTVPFVGWAVWTARRRRSTEPRPSLVAAWRPLALGLLLFAVPVAALVTARSVSGHGVGFSGEGPVWMYGRVADFADCASDHIPADERSLCPSKSQQEQHGAVWFQNADASPMRVYLAAHPENKRVVEDFARRVLLHQPLQYVATVLWDFGKQFQPTRLQTVHDPDVSVWVFPAEQLYNSVNNPDPRPLVRQYGTGTPTIVVGIAQFLHDYQVFGFLTGLVAAVLFVGGAVVLIVRRHHPLAPALWLFLSAAVMVMLVPAATVLFSWRYVLPTLVLYPPAGALAWTMWRRA